MTRAPIFSSFPAQRPMVSIDASTAEDYTGTDSGPAVSTQGADMLVADSFAKRLATLREEAGLSQYELARRSGMSKQALSNLELGNREPTWLTVRRLARAL